MGLTLQRTFQAESGGTISINTTTPDRMVTPCPVTFEVDISASDFDCSNTYDPVLDATFNGPHEPHRNRLFAFWSFGDSGHFENVTNEIPAEYSQKDRGLGIRTTHVYTDAAMTLAGTTYTVSVMVYEPSSGKVATATTTVTIRHYLLEASRIVLVNNTGDTDFTAFDATETDLTSAGWAGIRTDVNLSGATLTEADAAYAAHQNEDGVVWLLKGNGEAGSPEYDVQLTVSGTSGASHTLGAYGSGQVKVLNSNDNRVLALSGRSTLTDIRLVDWRIEGTFEQTTEVPLDSSETNRRGEYITIVNSGWWLIEHNVTYDRQGPGNGCIEIRSTATVSLCEVDILNTGSEYTILSGALDPELHVLGCRIFDGEDRLIRNGVAYPEASNKDDDVKNSHIRLSNRAKLQISKSRVFLNRIGAGQYIHKLGNNNSNGSIGHNYFNVLEAAGSIVGYNPQGGDFSEHTSGISECNIFIYTPYTQGICVMNADGITLRNNVCWVPAWASDVSQGDDTVRPRQLAGIGGNPPNGGWQGAPIEIYGNTTVYDLTPTQNGASPREFGDNYVQNQFAAHPYPPDTANLAPNLYPPGNVTQAVNQTLVWNYADPIDSLSDSATGPRTVNGTRISPKYAGKRLVSTGNTYDPALSLQANLLPSFRLGTDSSKFQAQEGLNPVLDYLGRRRGPKWSTGAAEDAADANVVGVATS